MQATAGLNPIKMQTLGPHLSLLWKIGQTISFVMIFNVHRQEESTICFTGEAKKGLEKVKVTSLVVKERCESKWLSPNKTCALNPHTIPSLGSKETM